jgi:HEXXH motif-containing protein
MPTRYRLSRRDLRAFVTGEGQAPALNQLRSAELSKHKILLAVIMRTAAPVMPGDYQRALANPYRLLAKVEARAPAIVRDLLASPQFGAWGDHCTRRLLNPVGDLRDGVPLRTDLGHLAVFAATAALRAGQPFELAVPMRDGVVTFPAFGTARPGASMIWEWGRVSQERRRGRVCSSVSTVEVPSAHNESRTGDGAWSDASRFVIDSGGLRLDVGLDSDDPFLDRYGMVRILVNDDDLHTWHEVLYQAWVMLTAAHRSLAPMIAGTVRTLVPLAAPSPTRSASATDISSFGAVALSLPADALSMAEALVHESHHAVLGAVMDVVPLVRDNPDFLAYAPWRDDPRPGSALLQGIFAHYGMGRFWRRQRRIGLAAQRLRGTAEFARLRAVTTQTADVLALADVLTEAGQDFLAAIRAELVAWHDEPVPVSAVEFSEDSGTEHRVRWRLRHLIPDPAAVGTLVRAWRSGTPAPVSPTAVGELLEPGPLPPAADNMRSYLLSLRYKDPECLRRQVADRSLEPGENSASWRIDPADAALVSGDHAAAAAGYLRRITAGDDRDAWAGLALARRHTGPAAAARVLTERPEVVVALYERLGDGVRPDPDELVSWLAAAR